MRWALYRVLLSDVDQEGNWAIGFLSTHPLTQQRIVELEQLRRENDWPAQGTVRTKWDFDTL